MNYRSNLTFLFVFLSIAVLAQREAPYKLSEVENGQSKLMIFTDPVTLEEGAAEASIPAMPLNLNGKMYYGYDVQLPIGTISVLMQAENYSDKRFPTDGNYSMVGAYDSPDYDCAKFDVYIDGDNYKSTKDTSGSFKVKNSSEQDGRFDLELFIVDLQSDDGKKIDLQGVAKVEVY